MNGHLFLDADNDHTNNTNSNNNAEGGTADGNVGVVAKVVREEASAQRETLEHLKVSMDKLLESKTVDPEVSTQIDEMKAKNCALESRNAELSVQNEHLETTIRIAETERKEMEESASKVKEGFLVRVTELETELKAAMRESTLRVEALTESKETVEQQLEEAIRSKDTMTEHISHLTETLEESKKNEASLQEEIRKLGEESAEKVAAQQTEIERVGQENSELTARREADKATFEDRLNQYKSDIERLQSMLQSETGSRETTEQEIAQLMAAKQELTDALAEANAEAARLEEQLGSSTQQTDDLRRNLKSTVEELNAAREEVTESHTSNTKLMEELNVLRSENEALVAANQELEDKLKISDEESREVFAEMDTKLAVLQQKVDASEQMVETTEANARQEREVRVGLEEEMEALAEEMEKREAAMEALQQELNASKKETTTLQTTLRLERETNASLCEQKNDAMEKGSNAAETVKDLKNQVVEAKMMIAELEEKRIGQSRELEDMEHRLKEATRERDDVVDRLGSFDERETELHRKLHESDKVRRELHNKVMQLTGNIRVFVRVRPPLQGEIDKQQQQQQQRQPQLLKAGTPRSSRISSSSASKAGKKRKHAETAPPEMPFKFPALYDRENGTKSATSSSSADDLSKNLIEMVEPKRDRGGLKDRRKKWRFGFDSVFTPDQGQDDVWGAAEPLVQSAIDGYNVCIFAYGQTGSGKSYTMLGDPTNEGIVTRAVSKLFAAKQEMENVSHGNTQVEISVELLEIYNEEVRDLLAPDSRSQKLKIANSDIVGNVLATAENKDDVMSILDLAQGRRCVKATQSNSESSRSHMVFTVHFELTSKEGIQRRGKLHICDLAGSERLSKSKANDGVKVRPMHPML